MPLVREGDTGLRLLRRQQLRRPVTAKKLRRKQERRENEPVEESITADELLNTAIRTKFPSNENLLDKWIKELFKDNSGRDLKNTVFKNLRICSFHFEKKYFKITETNLLQACNRVCVPPGKDWKRGSQEDSQKRDDRPKWFFYLFAPLANKAHIVAFDSFFHEHFCNR